MAEYSKIELSCPFCGGDGIVSGHAGRSCEYCEGSGYLPSSSRVILADGIVWAYQILNCIDNAEYLALEANKLQAVNVVLSLGIVDLNEGSKAREMLLLAFDAQSNTRNALASLIS